MNLNSQAQVVAEEPADEFKCKAEVYFIGMTATEDKLVVGTDDGAQVFDMNSGKKLHDLVFEDNRDDKAVFYIAFDETGRYCAGIGRFGHRVAWDLETGEEVTKNNDMHWLPTAQDVKGMGLTTKNKETDYPLMQRVATVPGNDDVTATAKSGKIEFASAEQEKVIQTLKFDSSLTPVVLFSGEYLITGCDDGTIGFYTIQ